jgi:hypothetical protein
MHLSISRRKIYWTTLDGIFVVLANIARTRRNKKDILATLDEIFVVLANIARTRRNIIQMIC